MNIITLTSVRNRKKKGSIISPIGGRQEIVMNYNQGYMGGPPPPPHGYNYGPPQPPPCYDGYGNPIYPNDGSYYPPPPHGYENTGHPPPGGGGPYVPPPSAEGFVPRDRMNPGHYLPPPPQRTAPGPPSFSSGVDTSGANKVLRDPQDVYDPSLPTYNARPYQPQTKTPIVVPNLDSIFKMAAKKLEENKQPKISHSPSASSSSTSTASASATGTGTGQTELITGLVTQMQEKFGMVSSEIFFQTSTVVGPMPMVGDKVVVEAERVNGMPFKFNGKRVQLIAKDLTEKEKEEQDVNKMDLSQQFERRQRTPTKVAEDFGFGPLPSLPSSLNLSSGGDGHVKSILKRNPPPPPILSGRRKLSPKRSFEREMSQVQVPNSTSHSSSQAHKHKYRPESPLGFLNSNGDDGVDNLPKRKGSFTLNLEGDFPLIKPPPKPTTQIQDLYPEFFFINETGEKNHEDRQKDVGTGDKKEKERSSNKSSRRRSRSRSRGRERERERRRKRSRSKSGSRSRRSRRSRSRTRSLERRSRRPRSPSPSSSRSRRRSRTKSPRRRSKSKSRSPGNDRRRQSPENDKKDSSSIPRLLDLNLRGTSSSEDSNEIRIIGMSKTKAQLSSSGSAVQKQSGTEHTPAANNKSKLSVPGFGSADINPFGEDSEIKAVVSTSSLFPKAPFRKNKQNKDNDDAVIARGIPGGPRPIKFQLGGGPLQQSVSGKLLPNPAYTGASPATATIGQPQAEGKPFTFTTGGVSLAASTGKPQGPTGAGRGKPSAAIGKPQGPTGAGRGKPSAAIGKPQGPTGAGRGRGKHSAGGGKPAAGGGKPASGGWKPGARHPQNPNASKGNPKMTIQKTATNNNVGPPKKQVSKILASVEKAMKKANNKKKKQEEQQQEPAFVVKTPADTSTVLGRLQVEEEEQVKRIEMLKENLQKQKLAQLQAQEQLLLDQQQALVAEIERNRMEKLVEGKLKGMRQSFETGGSSLSPEEMEKVKEQLEMQNFLQEEQRLLALGDSLALDNLYKVEDCRRRRKEEDRLEKLKAEELLLRKEKKWEELKELREIYGATAARDAELHKLKELRKRDEMEDEQKRRQMEEEEAKIMTMQRIQRGLEAPVKEPGLFRNPPSPPENIVIRKQVSPTPSTNSRRRRDRSRSRNRSRSQERRRHRSRSRSSSRSRHRRRSLSRGRNRSRSPRRNSRRSRTRSRSRDRRLRRPTRSPSRSRSRGREKESHSQTRILRERDLPPQRIPRINLEEEDQLHLQRQMEMEQEQQLEMERQMRESEMLMEQEMEMRRRQEEEFLAMERERELYHHRQYQEVEFVPPPQHPYPYDHPPGMYPGPQPGPQVRYVERDFF